MFKISNFINSLAFRGKQGKELAFRVYIKLPRKATRPSQNQLLSSVIKVR